MIFECDDKHYKIVEEVLSSLSFLEDKDIKSCAVIVIPKENSGVLTNYVDATIDDLILIAGHINLAITRRYMEINWPEMSDGLTIFEGEEEDGKT